ncbi:Pantothenate kinase 4 [Gryllus bimaculatus]|nr:Pantothenate kinase 4 [Gryllus bimaculatus]
MNEKSHPKSIKLPNTIEVFGNLKNAKRFAIDIGGSLTKIAYYSTVQYRRALYDVDKEYGPSQSEDSHQHYEVSQGARLHFIKFETKYIENCLDFVHANLMNTHENMTGKVIKATGGGAYKYTELLNEKLGLSVDKEDEISCLIKGCNFLLKNIPDEAFEYHRHGNPEYKFQNADPNIFPYLLVNIGSGVSIMKVMSDDSYERIGGTATGGGTFWGLGTLLTKAKGFDELLELAEKGDHRNVDMLVKDIYGGDYKSMGLPGDLIASSFGKAMHSHKDRNFNAATQFSEADVARSLLFTISNDVGQIACLYAMMHKLNTVYFGGYFLRNHPLSMHTVSFSINYWSRGQVKALFLRHEGYLGAIGAFLKGAEECDADKYSWLENYAGSSGLRSPVPSQVLSPQGVPVDQLEIDRWESALTYCPLLHEPASYIPDTVDLTQDAEAREYWLQCFEESVDKFVARAIQSQPDSPSAKERAHKFREKYVSRLHYLKHQPLRERTKTGGERASPLSAREALAAVGCDGVDTPARSLGHIGAGRQHVRLGSSRSRPWLIDCLDEWIDRLKGPPHRCAAIFVDNSGVDIILGVLPFARDLLQRGTQVILCANSAPALNDVTYSELQVLLKQVAGICGVFHSALAEGRLVAMESAQASPCLDLSRLNQCLADTMSQRKVDLLVIEGMGRALHTNLEAKFTCECLKLAVIKNRWLAARLGGDMYSVMCSYKRPHTKNIDSSVSR